MTTVKVGSKDAEGFHPNGDIVDPNGILDLVSGPLATKANASSLALKLDKTEAATTYVTAQITGDPANPDVKLYLNGVEL